MTNQERKEIRGIGLAFAIIAAGLGFWQLYRDNQAAGLILVLIALTLASTGALAPGVLRPFARGWIFVAGKLAWVNTRLLLGLFFFLVMTPLGLVFRLFGRDPLQRRYDPSAPSYWEPRPSAGPAPYNRPY